MISRLLNPIVQQYIMEHENDDEHGLLLKGKIIEGVETKDLIEQIVARRKSKAKLPHFYSTSNLLYPPSINLEQCSSELTAQYKASILPNLFPKLRSDSLKLVDLTGGFGVDSFFFSSTVRKVHYVEPNIKLLEIAQHNHQTLGATNITHHKATAEDFIARTKEEFDCIFLDPSRRTAENKKVFKLSECEPDITTLLPKLFSKASTVLVKVSPWLDIPLGLSELQNVSGVHIVSIDNDCKELLFICSKKFIGEPEITAVNITKKGTKKFALTLSHEQKAVSKLSNPKKYLYEPNSSIMKAGAFKTIGESFGLEKLHVHTHLYTSDLLINSFPGRIFETVSLIKADHKIAHQHFENNYANIITRNYPLNTAQLCAKLKLKEGGEKYLIAFTGLNEKHLVVATRIQ